MTDPFAVDRDVVLRPAVEAKASLLVEDAVEFMRAAPGHGLSGDDSGLSNVFEEWADQLAFDHSLYFELYDQVARDACSYAIGKLSPLEFTFMSAFTDGFDEHACTKDFIDNGSLEQFHARSALIKHVYGLLAEFAINYAEELADELELHRGGDDEPRF